MNINLLLGINTLLIAELGLRQFFNIATSDKAATYSRLPWHAKIQGWELAHLLKIAYFNERPWANGSGCYWKMSEREQFAQVAQCKRVNVNDSLRTNEWLWAIHSGRSWQMSDCEWIAQVAHDKWANVSKSLRSLMTNVRPRAWAIRSGCSG